ncbi:MAG: 5-formyltetrahydrofolate cyclo-ligase [Chiayiivirga sp.]|jgi:5-formyltetrahydrofolate cyclo-ligase|uniref:5-formyltetrahydrofolate cyclo-ligase n=1 Tax=Chiayiivirga sp. TaxID=2041042 RepID=UPI0025C39E8C|nr:5-formyltetrahydrofolate cyclo-ligase [Chiayiivirga sp.]MCI1711110.1 5-formyltetrahydrofolate cyclo-ligase [Chiayiivirga sp.]MCI1728093.1 5-formyltetrahydrofolate cyclo-ligase [Chiayiivirga sp.]
MTDTEPRRALREQMRARRNALPPRNRLAAADALGRHLRSLDALAAAERVAGYWAVRGELALHALLSPRPSYAWCLPCLTPESTLRFAPWLPGETLQTNRYGIPEPVLATPAQFAPEAIDVVLVPLLAFDRRGARLGSGGGYYDRSFAFLREQSRPARPLLVGVGYAFQQVGSLPVEPWDVALDYVATEEGMIRCTAPTA